MTFHSMNSDRSRVRPDSFIRIATVIISVVASALAFGVPTPSFAADGAPGWFERISFNGDFRGRSENFLIHEDVRHMNVKDRHRLRYRLRMGATSEINDHIDFGFRLATGSGANSGNQTLGSGSDFDPDGIFVDRAYITFTPHGKEKPLFGDSLDVTFGKMPNPFKPKGMGPALLIWDGDIMPEGVALGWSASPRDFWSTHFDVAYFAIDEISKGRDPGMFAVQLDNQLKLGDHVRFKSQISYYALRKLNTDFFKRSKDGSSFGGNTSGLSSSSSHIDLVEFHGGTTFTGHQDWPITVWGNLIFNASAEGKGEGKQNLGFGVGLEAGDKKAIAKIGVAYFQIEADALPSNLGDSDVFDGITNGQGFLVYVTRRIWKNTDFDVHAYFGDDLDGGVSNLQVAQGAKTQNQRVRIQTNIIVKF